MKKLVSIVLALAMIMMVAMASAATIQVQNVLDGETYTAYKILNYRDNGKTGGDRAVSYYLTSDQYTSIGSVLEAAGFAFTGSSDGTEYFVNNAETIDVAAVAKYLGEHTSDLGSALGTATATGANGSASFTNLPTGYYFVSSTAGTLCALHEESDIATAVEKNTIPGEDKTQSAAEDGTYAKSTLDFNVGDTVYYNLDITDGAGTNKAIVVTDTMTDGLDLNQNAITVTKDGTALTKDTDYTLTTSAHGFVLTLLADYVADLDKDDIVNVKYSAVINENAVVDDPDDNSNTARIEYSEQHDEQTIYVETYDFQLYKTDGTEFLAGAGFKLYDAATGGNQITVGKDATGYYVDEASDEEIMVDSANGVNVRGFAPGTYYLEETTVPGGYNKLAERKAVTITTGATAPVEITVVNQAGTQLPSTGGIGTTIFYIVGGILLVGAAVILIARRKAQD